MNVFKSFFFIATFFVGGCFFCSSSFSQPFPLVPAGVGVGVPNLPLNQMDGLPVLHPVQAHNLPPIPEENEDLDDGN